MDQQLTSPYPGLRPFTESESIFFKGRDKHVGKVIAQLVERRFVMVTGASGDGKSSLVYAGVINEARAGFFKARFNNWILADFRPERRPLTNMVKSLSMNLDLEPGKVQEELSYGFSALVDLYKSSQYYTDYESVEWVKASDDEKKTLKAKGANLIILVDQFEEFFTNPENYSQGKPSQSSQTVVNLILETARIALDQDLPIYVICTMRSDYIGQCAAFRGLPEYIGFSQFFVPRLNRKEMYQVIEEPAILSGGSVSQKVAEVLINEMKEGFDQLPVLQHALSQLWIVADNGKEQIDLMHMAKVGGIPADYLPADQRTEFDNWFNALHSETRLLYADPSLANILASHAAKLYQFANAGSEAPEEESKLIVKGAFQCLTKIDGDRAVRNRMTLGEIKNIINIYGIGFKKINLALHSFRQQGNTFISPFVLEGSQSDDLGSEVVLDITHESLIRNWTTLKDWAEEEHSNWQVFQDFNKQLQRWLASGKANGYLLSIGPLTYFEDWFKANNPNKHWLARYDARELKEEEKLEEAGNILIDAKEFIKRSANNLFFSRKVIKYGANRIATAFAFLALICTCSFYYYNYYTKWNEIVLTEIKNRGYVLLTSKKVKLEQKADFVINCERLIPGSYLDILSALEDSLSFEITIEVFKSAENYNDEAKRRLNTLINPIFTYMHGKLNKMISDDLFLDGKLSENNMLNINRMLTACYFMKSREPKFSMKAHGHEFAKILSNAILTSRLIIHRSDSTKNVSAFNQSIQLLIAQTYTDSLDIVDGIIDKLSPFESQENEEVFNRLYRKEQSWNSSGSDVLTHNGGYQILAYLYAVQGDVDKISMCLDSIIHYNPEYASYDSDNFYQIIGYLTMFGHFPSPEIAPLIEKFQTISGRSFFEIVEKVTNNNFKLGELSSWSITRAESGSYAYNFANRLIGTEQRDKLWDYYLSLIKGRLAKSGVDTVFVENFETGELEVGIIKRNPNNDPVFFKLAMYYKKRGIYSYEMGRQEKDNSLKGPWFTSADRYSEKAFANYSRVSDRHLHKDLIIGREGDEGAVKTKYSSFFLYPGILRDQAGWNIYRGPFWDEIIAPFLGYIIRKEKEGYEKHFQVKEDFKALERFLYEYYSLHNEDYEDLMKYRYYSFAERLYAANTLTTDVLDKDFLRLVDWLRKMGRRAVMWQSEQLREHAVVYLPQINYSADFQNRRYPMSRVNRDMIKSLAVQLALMDKKEMSMNVVNAIEAGYHRRNTLIEIVNKLQESGPVENSFMYLDTLFHNIEKENKYGMKLIRVLSMIGSQRMYDLSLQLIKDASEQYKPRALVNFIRGVAYNGYYHQALHYIPEYVSSSAEMTLYNEILYAEIRNTLDDGSLPAIKEGWGAYDKRKYGDDTFMDDERYVGRGTIIYISE